MENITKMKKDNFNEYEKGILRSFLNPNKELYSDFNSAIFIKDGKKFFYTTITGYDPNLPDRYNINAYVSDKIKTKIVLRLLEGFNVEYLVDNINKDKRSLGLGKYIQVVDKEFINISVEELKNIIKNIEE